MLSFYWDRSLLYLPQVGPRSSYPLLKKTCQRCSEPIHHILWTSFHLFHKREFLFTEAIPHHFLYITEHVFLLIPASMLHLTPTSLTGTIFWTHLLFNQEKCPSPWILIWLNQKLYLIVNLLTRVASGCHACVVLFITSGQWMNQNPPIYDNFIITDFTVCT